MFFNYFFIHVVLFTLVDYIPGDEGPVWAFWIHLLISLLAVIWGVRKTFEINKEGDDLDYFRRFISLSFVAGIRTIVVGIVISLILVIVDITLDHIGTHPGLYSFWKEVADLIIFFLLNVYFYYILITSFMRISTANGRASAIEAV